MAPDAATSVMNADYPRTMGMTPTREELEAAQCWDPNDEVPGRPAMTEFRRWIRYYQAQWREAHGHPIGSQPIKPRRGDKVRLVGSRMPFDYAIESGATFLTDGALAAARTRASTIERHQTFDHQRFWAELLWSPTLAVNLFGDLAEDLKRATRAVKAWWPEAPGRVTEIRFAHSPGRLDPTYMNSLRTFDAAFVLDIGDGTHGIVAIDVNYHDWLKPQIPRPENVRRYVQVAECSAVFKPDSIDSLKGRGRFATMWLEHLLLHSMLQHPSGAWNWGRYVVVHPAENVDFADGTERYRSFLADDLTFDSLTLEALLDSGVLGRETIKRLRERYLPS
jgi:PD-(D/E)XK nuclease superfamily